MNFSFFVSSFDPFAPRSRFHFNLAKALPASLNMRTRPRPFFRHGRLLNPDFYPPFTKRWWRRRRNVFARSLRINSPPLLRHLKTSLIDHARKVKKVLQPSETVFFSFYLFFLVISTSSIEKACAYVCDFRCNVTKLKKKKSAYFVI